MLWTATRSRVPALPRRRPAARGPR
jgi:hypothetical protein